MEILHNLAFGFSHALTMQNLMFCAIGCMVGTLVGLLPGLGPLATISLLLPLTYSIPTTGALIMLAGIYYGAQYGDSVSAITAFSGMPMLMSGMKLVRAAASSAAAWPATPSIAPWPISCLYLESFLSTA